MSIIKGNNLKNVLNGKDDKDSIYGLGGNDTLNGLGGVDRLYGGKGNDRLDGGLEADILKGGKGNDTYVVDNIGDVIAELKGGGRDTVETSVSWSLGAFLENLTLTGTQAINGVGNQLANILIGNLGNNTLDGGLGNDALYGGLGDDILLGGKGNDILDGGAGQDNLSGDLGNDTLILADFNGDTVNGGAGLDSLLVSGQNQIVDLSLGAISGIETIKFNADSNNTLNVTASSILALSPDSDTLRVEAKGNNTVVMEAGWVETGVIDGFKQFTKDGATLQIDAAINTITILSSGHAFTISDAASAANVSSAFTSGVDEITLDFGGKVYSQLGIANIDLSGFGVEDKLIIALHDGSVSNGTYAHITQPNNGSVLVKETSLKSTVDANNFYYRTYKTDKVNWQDGATQLVLTSKQLKSTTHFDGYTSYTTTYQVNHYTTTNGATYTTQYPSQHAITHYYTTRYTSKKSGQISLTGLPHTLPDSQFVFV